MASASILLFGFVVAGALVYAVRIIAVRRDLLDVPNERSSHAVPTPRVGGIGIVGALWGGTGLAAATGVLALDRSILELLLFSTGVGMLGLADDLLDLRARTRFGIQVGLAVAYCMVAEPLSVLRLPFADVPLAWMAYPLTVFWLVGMINLYNFMDGIDGLAGGMATIGAGFCAALLCVAGDTDVGLLSAVTAAVAGGFLLHNFPPARIFMGDSGSSFLGALFAGLAVSVSQRGTLPFPVFVMILAPFIFDTTVTLVRRISSGERWYAAHRTHFYQRLLIVGWSHSRVDLLEYALMIVAGTLAVLYVDSGHARRILLLAACVAVFTGFALFVAALERRHKARAVADAKESS